jgi:pimeloyl-ACP methyl ester carboxylesterase
VAGDPEGVIKTTVLPFVHRPVVRDVLRRFGQDAAKVARADLEGTLALVTATSFAERLQSVRVPALVVSGAHDPLITREMREAMVASLPDAGGGPGLRS